MSDKPLPFVITDRRRHTTEGEVRPDADPREPQSKPEPTPIAPEPTPESPAAPEPTTDDIPPAPTSEQMEQSRAAFDATAERIDTAVRAANPGAQHPPALTFESHDPGPQRRRPGTNPT